jgi:hypothetical protein
MTSMEMPVRMWCWPGPRAAAGAQLGADGEPVLTVFLDPVDLVLSVPPFPDGTAAMARFLRELSRSASRLANQLDPQPRRPGAHRLVEGVPEVPTS